MASPFTRSALIAASLLSATTAPAATVAYYQFNGGTNAAPVASAIDSVTGLTGTIVGGLKYITTNLPPTPAAGSSALDATPDFDFVRIPDNTAFHTGSFSVEVLFNPRYDVFTGGGTEPHHIINKLNTQAPGIHLSAYFVGYSPVTKKFFCDVGFGSDTGVNIGSTHTFNYNNWYDIVETYSHNPDNTATLSLYVNGSLEASSTFAYKTPFYGAEPLYIGAGNYTGENGQFRRNVLGYIDQVRITDNVLTPPDFLILPGDANGDGQITPDDYALTDRGFNQHLTGWSNGDFNGDGTVNAVDYLIIDTSYLRTHPAEATSLAATRESQFGPDYTSALLTSLPEPSPLLLLATDYWLLTTLLFPRRRRS